MHRSSPPHLLVFLLLAVFWLDAAGTKTAIIAQEGNGTSNNDSETGSPSRTVVFEADGSDATIFDYHQIKGRKSSGSRIGRREGELDFELTGNSRIQSMTSFGTQWSGNAHLLWDGVVGESMNSSFDVDRTGVYDVMIQLTLAGDYGLFRMTLPNTSVNREIDLYSPRVELAPTILLKKVRLEAGKQPIAFKLIGANNKARKYRNRGYLMGLDFIQLTPTDMPHNSGNTGAENSQDHQKIVDAVTNQRNPDTASVENSKAMTTQQLSEFTRAFCIDCHNGESSDTEVNFTHAVNGQNWQQDPELLRLARNAINHHEMPPETADQPDAAQRRAAAATLNALLTDYLLEHQNHAPTTMRRMTRYEYNNAVRDLLQLRGDIYPLPEKTLRGSHEYFRPATGQSPRAILIGNRTLGKNQVERQILTGVTPFAIDLQAEGGFNNRGEELGFSPILLESLLRLGKTIVHSPEFDGYCGLTESLFSAPESTTKLDLEACQRISRFLERAFRSPVEHATIHRYCDYFAVRLKQTNSFRHAMKDVVAAILASPRFVYLAEASDNTSKSQHDSYALATRLSFFLWSSIPDDELLATARDGSLLDPQILDEQTQRMLTDPKCHALTQNFARQWLRLDQLVTAVPDFERFPRYYSRIGCEQ